MKATNAVSYLNEIKGKQIGIMEAAFILSVLRNQAGFSETAIDCMLETKQFDYHKDKDGAGWLTYTGTKFPPFAICLREGMLYQSQYEFIIYPWDVPLLVQEISDAIAVSLEPNTMYTEFWKQFVKMTADVQVMYLNDWQKKDQSDKILDISQWLDACDYEETYKQKKMDDPTLYHETAATMVQKIDAEIRLSYKYTRSK